MYRCFSILFPLSKRCCPLRMLKSDDDLSRRCFPVSGGPMIFSFTQRFELKLRRFLSSNHRQIVGQLQANKRHGVNENRIWWKKRSESHKQSEPLSWIEVLWISISIHESYHWITSTLFLRTMKCPTFYLDRVFWIVTRRICPCGDLPMPMIQTRFFRRSIHLQNDRLYDCGWFGFLNWVVKL